MPFAVSKQEPTKEKRGIGGGGVCGTGAEATLQTRKRKNSKDELNFLFIFAVKRGILFASASAGQKDLNSDDS